jgi:hypothetical protein
MNYPTLGIYLSEDVLRDHFTLDDGDRALIREIRNDVNQLGFAVLFKVYQALGYPPHEKSEVPAAAVERVAAQIGLEPTLFQEYQWRGRVWMHHLSLLREHTGLCPCGEGDHPALVSWLVARGKDFPTRKALMSAAVERCRELRLELPTQRELWRLVNSAHRQFFNVLFETVSGRLSFEMKTQMDRCVEPSASEAEETPFQRMKSSPGPPKWKTIVKEIGKLRLLREFGLDSAALFAGYSEKILRRFRDRARAEDAAEIRRHPPSVRYTLLATLLHARKMEVTDNIVRIFLELEAPLRR